MRADNAEPMNVPTKLLFTAIGAVFVFVGAMAIVSETHTGYAKHIGVRTLMGDDAVWMGKTCLLIGLVPMLVWLPKRWVAAGGFVWWVTLMVWIFAPLNLR